MFWPIKNEYENEATHFFSLFSHSSAFLLQICTTKSIPTKKYKYFKNETKYYTIYTLFPPCHGVTKGSLDPVYEPKNFARGNFFCHAVIKPISRTKKKTATVSCFWFRHTTSRKIVTHSMQKQSTQQVDSENLHENCCHSHFISYSWRQLSFWV